LIEVDLGQAPELVGVNTAHPNPLVGAALEAGLFPELAGYDTIRREVKYGKNSRWISCWRAPGGRPATSRSRTCI